MAVSCVLLYIMLFAVSGSNAVSVLASVVLGAAIYFFLMVNLGGITEQDMETIPMGRFLQYLRLS